MFNRTKKAAGKVRTGIERGMGVPILLNAGRFIQDTVRGLFNSPKMEQRETFEQAMSRLHLAEDNLAKIRSRYLMQCVIFLIMAGFVFAYSIYLLFQAAFAAGIVSLLITTLLVVYALRAHFWAFQIKNRKLGCTLKEWWENKINSETKPDNSLKPKG